MATTVRQQPTHEESAARAFWNAKMQEHPNITGTLAIVSEVVGFFLNGHFIVAASRWIIRVGGYVAESALLFAVLWISATSVAPQLIELIMSEKTMQNLVSIALIVLALIPEIILANAIINAVGHWLIVARDRHRIMAWVWALAFTIPTVLFLYLTAYTLNTLAANNGNFVQAGAGMIGLRCFAGWTYGLLEMVYAGVGRKMLNQAQLVVTPIAPTPAAAPVDYEEIARQLLPLVVQEVRQIVPDTTSMVEQLQQLRANVEELTVSVATPPAAKSEPPDEPEQENIVNLQSYRQVHDDETDLEPETGPTPRVTVKLNQERSAAKRSTSIETKREPVKTGGTAQEKALRILKKYPDINATELAKKAQITPQYASRILKKQSM